MLLCGNEFRATDSITKQPLTYILAGLWQMTIFSSYSAQMEIFLKAQIWNCGPNAHPQGGSEHDPTKHVFETKSLIYSLVSNFSMSLIAFCLLCYTQRTTGTSSSKSTCLLAGVDAPPPLTVWRTWQNKVLLRHHSRLGEITATCSAAEALIGKLSESWREFFGPNRREGRRGKLLKDTQVGNWMVFFPIYIEGLNHPRTRSVLWGHDQSRVEDSMCVVLFFSKWCKKVWRLPCCRLASFGTPRATCGMGEPSSTQLSAVLTYMVKLEMKAAAGICISNTPSRASDPLFTIVHDTVVKAYREMIVDFTVNSDIRGRVSCRCQKVIYERWQLDNSPLQCFNGFNT